VVATAPPAAAAGVPEPTFHVTVACPKCGASAGFAEADVSRTCEFCGSLLVLVEEGVEPVFYLPNRLGEHAALVDALATHHCNREAPRIRDRFRDPNNPTPVLEWYVEQEVERLRERHLRDIVVDAVEVLWAPYRLALGDLGQAFVGRDRSGARHVSFRVFALECTLRGYRAEGINLRDRGLKIGLGNLRLLTPPEIARLGGRFLAAEGSLEAPREWATSLLDRAQDRTLAALQPPRAALLDLRQSFVFKPFVFVDYRLGGKNRSLLLDGSTAIAAGEPPAAEREELFRTAAFAPPRPPRVESLIRVHASRCPVCGHDQAVERRARLHMCTVCNRVLALEDSGMRSLSYVWGDGADVRPGSPVAWVPFWRFPFRLRASDGRTYHSLASWLGDMLPEWPQAVAGGSHLAVPATRSIAHPDLDQAFGRLARAVSLGFEGAVRSGPILPDTAGHRVPVTLGARQAAAVAPLLLYALIDGPRRSRVGSAEVRRSLRDAALELAEPELLFLSGAVEDGRLQVLGEEVALVFLDPEATGFLRERIRHSV
jgi:ribosomal protein S27E